MQLEKLLRTSRRSCLPLSRAAKASLTRGAGRYTLIELLMVVVISMIVLGVALPAFTKLGKASGVSGGARMIAGKINAARSYAVSHRKHVAVLFPLNSGFDSGTSGNVRYRAFRPVVEDSISTGSGSPLFNFTDNSYIAGEGWTEMPLGTFFGGTTYDVNKGHNNMDGIENGLTASNTASGITVPNCLVFKPDGSLLNSGPFALAVWEGGIQANGVAEPSNKSNKIVIAVNKFTGRPACSGR